MRRALPDRQGIVSRRTPVLRALLSDTSQRVKRAAALKAAPRKLATLDHLAKRIVRSILGCWRESNLLNFRTWLRRPSYSAVSW